MLPILCLFLYEYEALIDDVFHEWPLYFIPLMAVSSMMQRKMIREFTNVLVFLKLALDEITLPKI